jgi:hypothetical protein
MNIWTGARKRPPSRMPTRAGQARPPGEWTLSAEEHRAEATGADHAIQLQTDMLLGIEGGRARPRHILRAGETVYRALAWSEHARIPSNAEEAVEQLDATTGFWRDWLAGAVIPDPELGPLIQRSALAVKGLTFMPTGAAVAALTTSLPRRLVESAIGTTATPGSGTRPSCCARCTACSSTGRPTSSCSSWPTWTATRTAECRSYTGRWSPGSGRIRARGPVGLQRRASRSGRERRLRGRRRAPPPQVAATSSAPDSPRLRPRTCSASSGHDPCRTLMRRPGGGRSASDLPSPLPLCHPSRVPSTITQCG